MFGDFFSAVNWQIVEAVSTLGAAILAGLALWQARQLFKDQQQLNQKIHSEQQALAQRQLFIPLFEQFKGIATINPQAPVWPDVVNAVNFLDLLGICWEGQLVDEKILFRVYREFVIDTYERIKQCKNPPERVAKNEKEGEEMLRDSRAATSLYNYLVQQHIDRDKPEPLK